MFKWFCMVLRQGIQQIYIYIYIYFFNKKHDIWLEERTEPNKYVNNHFFKGPLKLSLSSQGVCMYVCMCGFVSDRFLLILNGSPVVGRSGVWRTNKNPGRNNSRSEITVCYKIHPPWELELSFKGPLKRRSFKYLLGFSPFLIKYCVLYSKNNDFWIGFSLYSYVFYEHLPGAHF